MNEPHILELAYWIAQIGLVFIVLASGIVALQQLKLLARQSQSTFLMELDKRWESKDLIEARGLIRKQKARIESEISANTANFSDVGKRYLYTVLFANFLKELRIRDFQDYEEFMQLWGFVETIGHLVKDKYVSLVEIDSIFGHVIIQLDDISRVHIVDRNMEESRKIGHRTFLYKNFTDLADMLRAARRERTRREQGPKAA